VIVFDEATSALDNENQSKIVSILEKYKSEKTIIIVAHRLSTIVGADKIYVIENGKNIAEGTHKKLMRSCKKYKELYELEEQSAEVSNIEGTED
jgi:ABC-type multidrug transport system fused ATPase/permease subunit